MSIIDLTGPVARIKKRFRDEDPLDDCDVFEPHDESVARDCQSDGHYRCRECFRLLPGTIGMDLLIEGPDGLTAPPAPSPPHSDSPPRGGPTSP